MTNSQENEYDIKKYQSIFKEKKYISLNNFLHSTSATNLYKHFPHVTWKTKFITRFGEEHLPLNEYKDEFEEHIIKHGERNFTFHFDFFEPDRELMGRAEIKDLESPQSMADLFVSKLLLEIKKELQSFIPELTCINELEKVYIGCQRYKAGHFLKPHTDRGQGDYGWRRIAFSLHMTPDWEAEWGGQTVFTPRNNPNLVTRFVSPTFNTLHVFEVNDDECHHVVPVAKYTKNTRYAIQGWLHTKDENA